MAIRLNAVDEPEMIRALNEQKDKEPEEVLNGVRRAVDSFVRESEQFDDLTMLSIEYKGNRTLSGVLNGNE